MKFEALMNDQAAMRTFSNVSLSLKKIGKTCILKLSKNKVFFIFSEKAIGFRRPSVWCELPIRFYFEEYEVVRMDKAKNDIFLELPTASLAETCSILKQNTNLVKIKITESDDSDAIYLTFDMELPMRAVKLLAEKYWSGYGEEPASNAFHASIQMPQWKNIKPVVDSIKNLSEWISLSIEETGKLTLENFALDIDTSAVKLKADFPELLVHSFVPANIPNTDEDNVKVTATIDSKKFLNYLSGMQILNCPAICSIAHERLVKLSLDAPGRVKLQIFVFQFLT
ncbi:unnamed protein product [Ceutorhynchus assimilis]|uniref:Checkpoint protein n=1 Tax=Ceutorhynchus assimilis TaxID=467358 RepID=A0A9N9ME81_9CUCU|nr:unnamed protein product [Ceutorhynchus assimilis]